ncbi:nucleotidyltransferase domain-containing protein, partial [Enterobacter hormaechei]
MRSAVPGVTTLLAVHLYGSAVDGGLKPHSDIDLLVTVTV